MSKWRKVKNRIVSKPKDLQIEEVVIFLESLGYESIDEGTNNKTILFNEFENRLVIFNSSNGIIDGCSLKGILDRLQESGDL